MGYSCTEIKTPRVQTRKPVEELEGATVWLIAGEGSSPKSYFLAATFVVSRCEPDSFPSSKFPNLIAGGGSLFGKRIPLDGTSLLGLVREESANFVRGLYETKNAMTISALQALV